MIRVKGGIFSFTPPAPLDDDGGYLRWHLLDHMPEQYQLPGLVYALRWIADGDYLNSRIAAAGQLSDVGNIVNYLIGDPVEQTVRDFNELGARLAEVGRFPHRRKSLQLRALALLRWYAAPHALVSPEVVPMRPHRGVLVVVEQPRGSDAAGVATVRWLQWLHVEHYPGLLATPGVAGAWMFGGPTSTWQLPDSYDGDPQYVTVVYFEEDPLAVTGTLAPLLEQRWTSGAVRPLFAGPFRTMIDWEAWR